MIKKAKEGAEAANLLDSGSFVKAGATFADAANLARGCFQNRSLADGCLSRVSICKTTTQEDWPKDGSSRGQFIRKSTFPREEDTASMTGDLALLEKQLAAQPFHDLEIVSRRFPRKNHFNVVPEAFAAGFAALFGR